MSAYVFDNVLTYGRPKNQSLQKTEMFLELEDKDGAIHLLPIKYVEKIPANERDTTHKDALSFTLSWNELNPTI